MTQDEIIREISKIETSQEFINSKIDRLTSKIDEIEKKLEHINKEVTKVTVKQGIFIMAIVWGLQIVQKWLFGV